MLLMESWSTDAEADDGKWAAFLIKLHSFLISSAYKMALRGHSTIKRFLHMV